MIATLRLEAIGDNHVATGGLSRLPLRVALRQLGRVASAERAAALDPKRRPWVAKLSLDARGQVGREFVRGLRDYRDSNRTGSRGVWVTYVLRGGAVYEVRELLSWARDRRYFCHADAGSIVEIEKTEVLRRLAASASSAQSVINQARRT